MAKKTTSKKTTKSRVSKGRKAVLKAFKAGKVHRDEWFTDNGAPVCPIANYGLAYGIKPVFEDYKNENGAVYYREFDEDAYLDKIAKFFGVSLGVIDELVSNWDSIDPEESFNNDLLEGINLKEIALTNFIDIFEKKAKKKSVIFGS